MNLVLTTTSRSFISWLDTGIPPAPNSSCHHVVLHAGHLLATVFRLYSLERWTTLARRILIVADVSPSSGASAPRGRSARRCLALGGASSPNRSDDGSGAMTLRTGGGGRRHNVADHFDEDGPDNDFNPETFLNSLAASNEPMLKQFGAYLKAKDETISVLQQQVKNEQNKRAT